MAKCYVGKLALWKRCKHFAKTLYIKDTVDLCGHSSQKKLLMCYLKHNHQTLHIIGEVMKCTIRQIILFYLELIDYQIWLHKWNFCKIQILSSWSTKPCGIIFIFFLVALEFICQNFTDTYYIRGHCGRSVLRIRIPPLSFLGWHLGNLWTKFWGNP